MRNLARFATIFSILTTAPQGAFAQQRPPGDGDQKRNENRGPVAISSIGFEEGPNNTVISITTSETPTFTVFKLVDPVRLLVDVAGGDVTVATPRVQVRNGVIHDIETAQFASQGKTIGRIVIGFDVEASYSVKTDGNTIRIVVDGAERMTGKLGDAQSAELVKKAQAALEAEKQLREELLAARARETTLVENERSAKNALEQLQAELDRVAADSKRLQGLLDDARSGRGSDAQLTEAATQKADEQRKTLEAAADAARQKVAALSAEQQQLEAERAALKRAVDAAEKRKVELSNALAAEEARREAARRARQEEEQLAAAAKAARVAEETRIEALRDVGSAEADKTAALAKAKKEAEQLRLDQEKSAARVSELETALVAAKRAEGAVGKTTSKLEAELEKVKRERDLAVKAADKAKREAELDVSEKADMHASALERLRAANDNLEAQLADQKKQATLAERAKRSFEEKLEESARAIEALKRRDDERLEAEAEVARLEKERVQSAQRARDLERDNKALLAKAERLEAEKTSLQRAVASGRKVEGIEDALASHTAELARIKGAIEDARGERTEATRSREAAEKEADAVRVKLARERADLAAVLQQKELFSKEIATLRDRRDTLSRDASAEEQRLQTAQVRLKRLEGERTAAEEKVAALRQEVARLEGSRREEGSRDTLEERLAAKNGEIAAKKAEIAALQKALSAEKTSGQEALSERDKRLNAALENARAEARKSEEGQKKLAQLEKFLASQRTEIDKLRAGDKSGALAQKERELATLEKELAAARAQNEKAGPAVLQTARAELKAAESRLSDLETQLAREQKARAAAEQDLADAKGQIDTLESEAKVGRTELASAKRRIEELTRLSADASGDVERLEKKLAAARADGDGGKAIAEELAEAKIALRRAEKRLTEEQRAREEDEKQAAARVNRLEGEKDTLKAKILAQEKALASAATSGSSDKELARARQKIAELSRDLTIARVQSKQSGEIERLQAEKAKLQAELARREKGTGDGVELAKLRQELASAKAAEKSLEAELADARQNRSEAAELARLSKAVRAAEARAETAEGRADSAESAGRKAREALSVAETRADSAESAGRKAREALSAAEARLATLSDEKEQTEQRVARLEKELSTARRTGDDASALERELADARTARTRLERSMDAAEKTLAEVTRERDAARKDARAAEGRATTAEKARAKAGEALAAANAKLETLSTEREEAIARVARLEADVSAARKAGSGTSSLARELDEARREQERLEKSVASLKRAARDAEAERDVARQDADAAVKATSVAQRRADEAKKDAETAKADLRAAKARISRLQADAEAADERVAAVEKQLKSAQARGGNTSALTAELEGAKSDLARARQELKAERSEREAIRKEASAEVARLEADKKSLEKDLAEAKRSGRSGGDEQLAATLEAKEAEIAALTSQLATARSHAGAAEELARVVAESEKARADLQKAQERISSLEKERTLDKSTAQVESALTRITNVAFHEKNNVSRVEIELDGKAGYEIVEKTDQKMVLVVDKARIPKLLERRLDTRDFYGPVATVSSFTDPDDDSKVRVVVELNEAVKNQVTRRGNALVWEFYNGQRVHMGDRAYASADDDGRSGVQFRPSAVGGERSEPFGSAPPVGGVTLPGGGGGTVPLSPQAYSRKRSTGRKYKGQKINLSIKDADIQQVLTFLAREGGVNIVTGQAVQGTVTVHLKDVPWDLALDMVLKSQGLDYVEEDGVYRVALAEAIRTEFEAEVEKRKKMNELRQLVVKLVSVNYADAEQISAQVKGVLSEKGTVTVDARTNTLIIKDVEEHVLAGEDIVRRLDTQTPQVLIEARIVEASSNFTEDIGIQWGGNYTASPAFGNETGLVFPAIVGFSGAADDSTSPVTGLLQDQPKFAVNLPAAVGAGSGGGIALTLGSLTGAGNLNLRLTAAEERGQLKIISSPRIATLDNNQATIRQGISIPISVVSSLGVNTQFFNAELALQVTPQVTQDGNVNLAVNITKNEPNFSQTGANGNPTIERKEATTQLLVRDGDTAVIGGIYTRNASQDFKKVPVLADIPFLGWLFKNRTVVDKRTELILFITPRIINRAAARVRVD